MKTMLSSVGGRKEALRILREKEREGEEREEREREREREREWNGEYIELLIVAGFIPEQHLFYQRLDVKFEDRARHSQHDLYSSGN